MLSRNHPDRIQITFDDRRLVANAGLLLRACLISLCAGIWVWDWCKLGARKHAGR